MNAGTTPRDVPDQVARPSHGKIDALTSTRFLAALYVVFFHLRWGVVPGTALDRFVSAGYCSVCFFFLLSGYILGVVYLRRGKSVSPGKFYAARFARIYPLYIASVLADAPFAVIARVAKYGLAIALKRVAILFAASAFMLQMGLPTLTIINIPSWSLSIETVFYLSFPLLGPLVWRLGRTGLLITGGGLWLLSVLAYWLVYRHNNDPVAALVLPSYTVTFALGILVARLQAIQEDKKGALSTSNLASWSILAICLAIFAGVVQTSPWLKSEGIHLGLLLAPLFAALIWLLTTSRIVVIRWLSVKWLVILGEASYGLYLIHVPMQHAFLRFHLFDSLYGRVFYLASCIALSVISFYFFETPARKWILSRFHLKSKETIKQASAAS